MIRNFFVLFCVLTLSIPSMANEKKFIEESLRPQKLVLSIGINDFASDLWTDLRFSGKDASDVYKKFTSSQVGFDGGLLLNSQATQGKYITKQQILNGLDKIADANRFEDDTVIVYLSTHGTVYERKDGKYGRYIITSDTDPDNMTETAIEYDDFVDKFNRLKSRKKVLILAFCHSGVGKSVLTPQMKRALATLKAPYFEEPVQEKSEGTIILTASGWREPASEDPNLQNDIYTYFLLDGFNQDKNGDGAVSITEAHAHASTMTYQYTKGRQRPSAIMELLGSDPVIIKGKVKKTGKASLYSLLGRLSNLLVSVDGRDMGSLEKGIVVPDGKVRLTLREPDSKKVVADRVVNFEAGREYSVANFLTPRLPNTLTVGSRMLYFPSDDIRSGYAPTNTNFVQLNYRLDEAISVYDLLIRFGYAPKISETIEAENIEVEQERTMASLDVMLGNRFNIRSLSSSDRFLRSEGRFATGLSGLYIDRLVKEQSFFNPSSQNITPGLVATLGLDMILPYHLIKFGGEMTVGSYLNFTDQGDPLLWTGSGSIFLGTFW